MDIARSLPIGSWFVWPGPFPKHQKCYRPKVYCVLEKRRPSAAVYTDLSHWTETTGPKAPGAAYAHASLIAATLNEHKASREAAHTYLEDMAGAHLAEAEPSTC